MVEKYIHELLYSYDCVILPDFGGFVTHRVSADIHPLTNKFYPPSKTVAFNEQLNINDGLLISHISRVEKLSMEESGEIVKKFTQNVKENLVKFNIFILPNVGRFFLNFHGNLEFEPDYSINLLDDSFGLTELYSKPIDRNYSDMSKISTRIRPVAKRSSEKQNADADPQGENLTVDVDGVKQKRSFSYILVLPLVLLVLSTAALFYINKTGKSIAGIIPGISSKHSASTEEDNETELTPESNNTESIPATASPDLSAGSSEFNSDASGAHSHDNTNTSSAASHNETSSAVPGIASTASLEDRQLNIVTERTGKIYIIIGSFSQKKNALKMRKKIVKQGGAPFLIESPHKDNYKVAINRYNNMSTAISKLEIYKPAFGDQIWVLTY